MWDTVKKFLQHQDPNGDWSNLEITPENVMLAYNTISDWLEDGLETSERISGMCVWLALEHTNLSE